MQGNKTLYAHPFSKAYWRTAAAELRDTRTLVFAALMIALRVVFKAIKIPVGPYLDINTAFLVNALGAMSFGPVVAIAAAAITDTLGCLLFPTGPYFFPFILTEIAGSLIFALLLYRTKVTVWRVVLARFLICFLVNIVIQTPIMVLYYDMALGGKQYAWIDWPRIMKNLALFPAEAVVLVIFLRYTVPPLNRQGYIASTADSLVFTKKTVALLVSLTLLSFGTVVGFTAFRYDTRTISAEYSEQERFAQNERMNAMTLANHPELDPQTTVSIVDSATSSFFNPVVTYQVSVYRADAEKIAARVAADPEAADMQAVRSYSKSKPAKDDALTRLPEYGFTYEEPKSSYTVLTVLLAALAAFLVYKGVRWYRKRQGDQASSSR